jgi:hypothetical protein
MSLSTLTDSELLNRLHEGRSFLDGLVNECNARHWGAEAMYLVAARDNCADTIAAVKGRLTVLKPWEFLKPSGAIGLCAWCERDHGHSPGPQDSHGICPAHLSELRADIAHRRVA